MDNDPGAPRTYEQVARIGYGLASELFGPDVIDEEEALRAQENFASPPIDFFLEALVEPLIILAWDRVTKAGRQTKTEREEVYQRMLKVEEEFQAMKDKEYTMETSGEFADKTAEYYAMCEEFEKKCRPFACGKILTALDRVTEDRIAVNEKLTAPNPDCKSIIRT